MSVVFCEECGCSKKTGTLQCSNPLCKYSHNAEAPRQNAMFVAPDQSKLIMWCPGCRIHHIVTVKKLEDYAGPVWSWNGDQENVTLVPSIKVTSTNNEVNYCCHSFVENGQWRYLSDCTHKLAGQTVPMEPVHI